MVSRRPPLGFTAFQGVDLFGSWPAGSASPLPAGGTLRIGDVDAASFEGGGVGGPRHWTYNAPLNAAVIGETVAVSPDSRWVLVGTATGRVAAFPVATHDESLDPFWEAAEADPETAFHVSTTGSWYGGCRHLCFLPGGHCPDVCPTTTGLDPVGYGHVELESGVRVLLLR